MREYSPQQSREIIDAFLGNIGQYALGERDLDSTLKSLDHLASFAPDEVSGAFQTIIDHTPEEEQSTLVSRMMQSVIWSQYVPQVAPPARLVEWIRARLTHPDRAERQAAIGWLIRHKLFDWETDRVHLEGADVEFLSEQLARNVPADQRLAIFRILRLRYGEVDDNEFTPRILSDPKSLEWVAYRLKRANQGDCESDASLPPDAEVFVREATDFLTRELHRVPFSAYETNYSLRQLWQEYTRGAEGPDAIGLLTEIATTPLLDPASTRRFNSGYVIEVALAALARLGEKDALQSYLELFEKDSFPHSAHFLVEHDPRMWEEIRDHLLTRLAGEKPIAARRETWQLQFLLRYADGTVLDFIRQNAERLPTVVLGEAAWRVFPERTSEVLRVLQQRELLDPAPLKFSVDSSNLAGALHFEELPHTFWLSSDSDEYPPRYDQALRDLAAISRGRFPAGRVRQRVIPVPGSHGEDDDRRVEVSWYLDDRRFCFQIEFLGDFMNLGWLLRAANEALEMTGRSGRAFAVGDGTSHFNLVFGEPTPWIDASREFSFPLHTEPEIPEVDEASFRFHLLRRFQSATGAE
ncbi:MAG: hypothetical protein KDN18_07180 [Verrucomicrobiae bacterium]|nr:hypothetical protein [Verrucomicrobiae bacterium]